MKPLLGVLLALLIGALCRLSGIPVPAPPAVVGGLLVLSMTVGYLLADRFAAGRPAHTEPLCGGPTGTVANRRARP